tara:strand:+ start:278 stop:787 length:510 start_codon:yes stop_codon:yes gene_type:complete
MMSDRAVVRVRLCSVCRCPDHDKRKCDMHEMNMRYMVSKNDMHSLRDKNSELKKAALEAENNYKNNKIIYGYRRAEEIAQHGDNLEWLNVRLKYLNLSLTLYKRKYINKKATYEKHKEKLWQYIQKSNTNEKALAKNVDAVLKKHSIPVELCDLIASYAYTAPVKSEHH